MSPVVVVVGVVAAAAVIFFLIWWFGADQQARRRMRAVPVRSIADVIEGEVARVVGEARVAEPIPAPLSGRPCAYWRVVVEEHRRSGKNSRWVTVVDEHDGVDFLVADATGQALVKTAYVHPVLERDASFSSGFLNDPTPELEAFLADRGHTSQGFVFNKSMRYREGVVEPGETVAAVGVGRWEVDPDPSAQARAGYRDRAKRLVLDSTSDGPLLLSDEPSNQR